MIVATSNKADEPVTVPELISFYTEVLNGISASDRALVQAFDDASNLTTEQRDAYAQWLDARTSYIQDVIQLAMARHIFEVDNRN
ncbi:hypothetical protein IB024_04810 [Brucella sp. 6810]|uniref:hypothetical protein n=1 Tax=Brucella sp. 6810 TaxID=2769351 RepID=UPI00165BFADF|nr:hypothetical protein [Brucella sp. 6810]QNQ63070.1 hypothetical protein IB024_04810 [Brucella sp. 6810]